jgi:hypothetical protein
MGRSPHELNARIATVKDRIDAAKARIREVLSTHVEKEQLTPATDHSRLRETLLFLHAEVERWQSALAELEWVAAPAKDDLPRIAVSKGELVDRISILRIKVEKVKDEAKLAHARRELDALMEQLLFDVTPGTELFDELEGINRQLWETEDILRDKERRQEFDAEFVAHARRVYKLNDRRGRLKNRINEVTGSSLVEVKHYADYPA